jgi:hypothetical protein
MDKQNFFVQDIEEDNVEFGNQSLFSPIPSKIDQINPSWRFQHLLKAQQDQLDEWHRTQNFCGITNVV